jgi:hypothetical protein
VAEGERCLPAKMRRRLDVGRFVRSSRSDLRVEIVVVGGRESGIATNIVSMNYFMGLTASFLRVKTYCRRQRS